MSTEYNLNDVGNVTLVVEEKERQTLVTIRNKSDFTKKIQLPAKRLGFVSSMYTKFLCVLTKNR